MKTYANLILFVLTSIALPLYAASLPSDMPGSKDHPQIPRVEGTKIVGYAYSSYDEGMFMTGMENQDLQTETVEGKLTRIVYLGPEGLSSLGILRNYQKALGDLGEVKEVFTCRKNACYSNLPKAFIWRSDAQIPTSINDDGIYTYANDYRQQSYWYGTVQVADALYHVSVYSAVRTNNTPTVVQYPFHDGQSLTHLEIIEVADFKPTLEVVKAEEMSAKISEKGHIALYGIYFDSGSDELKSNSDPALEEITRVLKADTSLKLYVVGHTDTKGTLEYNQDLSKRRATSVVRTLTNDHGVAGDRLTPAGAGLIAPVATNDTEEGRALNRRVELVKQ